jgi:hypothetical protein
VIVKTASVVVDLKVVDRENRLVVEEVRVRIRGSQVVSMPPRLPSAPAETWRESARGRKTHALMA